MKFNCGMTKAEKKKIEMEELRWHRSFSFMPVRVGPRDFRWLETVERRLTTAFQRSWYESFFSYWTGRRNPPSFRRYEYRAIK